MSSARLPLTLQKQRQDPNNPLIVSEEKEAIVADESTPLVPKAQLSGFSFLKLFNRVKMVKQVNAVPVPFDLFKLTDVIQVLKERRDGCSLAERIKVNEALKFIPYANNINFQAGFYAIYDTTKYLTKTKNFLTDYLKIDVNDESAAEAMIAMTSEQQKILTTLGITLMDIPTATLSDKFRSH